MKEIWKDIKGFEGRYQISNKGSIKSLGGYRLNGRFKATFPDRIMKPSISPNGYYIISLCKNSVRKYFSVHRLVALHFVKNNNKTKNKQINHIDCDKTNNNSDNLEWCDSFENMRKAYENNLVKINKGEDNGSSKISSDEVISIIEDYNKGETLVSLSKKYKISKSNIYFIVKGQTWKHLGYKKKKRRFILDLETSGLSENFNYICSMTLKEYRKNNILNIYFKPDRNFIYEEEALKLNGMSIDFLKEHGVGKRKAVDTIIKYLNGYKAELIGHNVGFDIGFLKKLFESVQKNYEDFFDYHIRDTSIIANFLNDANVTNFDSVSLTKVYATTFGKKMPHAHTSLGDVKGTEKLYKHFLDLVKQKESRSIRPTVIAKAIVGRKK